MKKNHHITRIQLIFGFSLIFLIANACSKNSGNTQTVPPVDTVLTNHQHLDQLYVPVVFSDGTHAAGVFIYSQYPDYHPVEASGEGYTCVDDVSRAALFYLRSPGLKNDTAIQSKLFNLIQFMLEMQAPSGYFYNFLQQGSSINMFGTTSVATPNWWSWRALQSLTEAYPVVKGMNAALAVKMDAAIQKLISAIKSDMIPLPETTEVVSGVTIPQWLPAGSGTDQAATMILGLINYSTQNPDSVLISYVRKLADGLVLMQLGDSVTYPYDMILSWQNTWHAYGSDQALALLQAGVYLNDSHYVKAGIQEINNLFPWILKNNFKSSVIVNTVNGVTSQVSGNNYDQIAYGFRPLISAAAKAFQLTGDGKYADLAGQLAAWFMGANDASAQMYNPANGVCFDGISAGNSVNKNSGAESTIEVLLSFQIVEANAEIKTALNKYKK
jgi:hypothetical protein